MHEIPWITNLDKHYYEGGFQLDYYEAIRLYCFSTIN